MKKATAVFLVLFFSLWIGVSPAAAHAVPVSSSPQSNAILEDGPAELSIVFNEPVVSDLSRITVLTQAGQEIETGALRATDAENRTLAVDLSALDDGAYLVSWQVLSAVDGHTTSGSFSFGVGVEELATASQETAVTAQLSPLSAIARWLTLTGLALVLGLFVFRLLIWNPVLAGVELEEDEEEVDVAHAHYSLRVAVLGLALVALGLVLIFIDQARTYNLLQQENIATWIGTRFGSMWLLRFFLTAVFHFHLSLFINVTNDRQTLRGWEWWVGLGLAVGLATTTSLISHSAALLQDTWQAVAVDLSHTLAAGVWGGGLLYLVLALRETRRLPAESRTWFNLSLILNFSAVAAMAVGVLLASGSYLAWKHVGSWTALVGTAYGLTLLAKVGLALPLLVIAAVNLLFLKPRLNAAFEEPRKKEAAVSMRRFRRLAYAEAALAFLILAAAGVLTDLQRGEDAPLLADAPGKMVTTQTADDLDVTLTIEPALVGQNSFDVYLTDAQGEPVTDANEVSLRYTFLGQSIGAATGEAIPQGNGHYLLEGSFISLIGRWQVEVAIRRPGAFDTFAPYRLEAGLGGNIRPLQSNGRFLERFARFMTLAGGAATGGFMVLFALGWGFLATRATRREWQLVSMLAISVLAFWIGANQLFTFFTEEFTPATFLTNPILPDVDSIATGEALFQENCVPCHGPAGQGDGPLAATLDSPPADFSSGHTASHPDGDLFFWIRNGIENTPMPAFAEQLSEEETWHLVNYVRRLGTQSAQPAAAQRP